MSIQSALALATNLHHYHDRIKNGFYGDKVYFHNNDYYLSQIKMYSEDLCVMGHDAGKLMAFSSCCEYTKSMYFNPESEICFDTTIDTLPNSVLDLQWDCEENYFQQSLLYSTDMLDSLVVLWYFKELGFNAFYIDWGACELLREDY